MSIQSRLDSIISGKLPEEEILEDITDLEDINIGDILVAFKKVYIDNWYMDEGKRCIVTDKVIPQYFELRFDKNCLHIRERYNEGVITAELGLYKLKQCFKKVKK